MIGTVMDIETTGFLKFQMGADGVSVLSDESEILEVGYINIDMNSGEILNYGTLYFYKPYFNIESDAQQVHGITRDFLKQYENDFDKNLIALNSLIQSTCLIGKNSDKFDIPFVKAFIKKHAGNKFDITSLVFNLGMKGYDGGYVSYDDSLYPLDLQTIFAETFRGLYQCKYTNWQYKLVNGRLSPADEEAYQKEYGVPIDYQDLMNHPPISPKKRGTLSEYVDIINGWKAVDTIYNGFDKERITRAHGALYDAVMTYIVWYYCRATDML